jgi:hypothetical protein
MTRHTYFTLRPASSNATKRHKKKHKKLLPSGRFLNPKFPNSSACLKRMNK